MTVVYGDSGTAHQSSTIESSTKQFAVDDDGDDDDDAVAKQDLDSY
jgi:hypothetical protein